MHNSEAAFRAALGPAAIFVRAEVRHPHPRLGNSPNRFATSSQPPTAYLFQPQLRSLPSTALRFLDAYVAMNLKEGWQL